MKSYQEQKDDSKESKPPRQISFFKFFSFLSFTDKALLVFGTLAAIIAGAILPSISLVMGNVAVAFSGGNTPTGLKDVMSLISSLVLIIVGLLFVFCYLFYAFWQHLAQNITRDLRKKYIWALMNQEVSYFEMN
jgi:ATP-binding cassette, subfamily B (MDR/TAP), member 1